MNLYSRFRERFPADHSAVCIDPVPGDPISFAALDADTARMQAELAARGVRAGDRVAVQVEKSAELVLLYLACLRRGAVFLPLNPGYTDAEVAFFLEDARPALFVCDPARKPGFAAVATLGADGRGSFDTWRARDPDSSVAASRDDDLAALLYTSGTTGRPKGAMLSHGNLAANVESLVSLWRFAKDDVLLHALPLFHAHGLFVALHCALWVGARTVLLPRFDADRVAQRLADASVYMGVPTHYVRLLALPDFDATRCRRVRLFVSGSAPLTAVTWREFAARTGHEILERYGMTETLMITSNPYDERVAGSVGMALPGVELRVVDAEGRSLSAGETGVLEVRSPSVLSGYWNLPEKTREVIHSDGFFTTGDLACIAPDGRVTLVGRARDLVISGGLNVYPAEVEAALDDLPGVAESAVIGVAHPDLGEGVTAVVVPDGRRPLDEAEVRARLGERLAGFKVPKRVFFVDALPRNAMGKVQKAELRAQFQDAFAPRGVRE